MSAHTEDMPLLTFGVITDVQYADINDRPAEYDPTKIRFYRNSHDHITKAFKHWENLRHPVHFALQLGDIIDGLCMKTGHSYKAIESTLSKFKVHSSIPTFHTIGNHELYNFKRHEFFNIFHDSISKIKEHSVEHLSNRMDDFKFYYKFYPNNRFKFISLDCFDISVLGYDSSHPKYMEAAKILEHHHKHDVFEKWDCDSPLKGIDTRFQQMNGAIGKEQLDWLDEELSDSDQKGEMVVVFGHVNLSPECTDWSCLLWNYEEVIACFHRHHCVVAYLSGHSHKADRFTDEHGIHYIVFSSVVETPLDSPAFATLSISQNQIKVTTEETYFLAAYNRIGNVDTDLISSPKLVSRTASETFKMNV